MLEYSTLTEAMDAAGYGRQLVTHDGQIHRFSHPADRPNSNNFFPRSKLDNIVRKVLQNTSSNPQDVHGAISFALPTVRPKCQKCFPWARFGTRIGQMSPKGPEEKKKKKSQCNC